MKRAISMVGSIFVEAVHAPNITLTVVDASGVSNVKIAMDVPDAERLLAACRRWYLEPVSNTEVPDAYEMIDIDSMSVGPAAAMYQDDLVFVVDCDDLAGDSDHKTIWFVPFALARHLVPSLSQALSYAATHWTLALKPLTGE